MAVGAEDAVAAADCVATVAVLAAGDELVAAVESVATVAGAAGGAGLGLQPGRGWAAGVSRVVLLESCCAPPLLLIVMPGATSAVDDVEPASLEVESVDVDVVADVEVVSVVPVEVEELGAELVSCVGLVADSVELVSEDVDELLAGDEDGEDDGSSAAATPWPVATAVTSHAETASPP